MSITYNDNVPLSSNNPSNDQPAMLINTQSINSIWGIDHITFNSGAGQNSGQHQFVNFNGKNTPAAPSGNNSALFTVSGTASSNADMRFQNPNGTFPVNSIRAWAFVDNTGAVIASQSINVNSITHVLNTGLYNVTLTPNSVTGSNFAVLVSFQSVVLAVNTVFYTITGAGTFSLQFLRNTNPQDPTNFSFQVLQI